jgi:hypothetical protein
MNHALLKIVASAALGHIPTGPDAAFPVWKGPDSSVVRVQAILYSSLATFLFAACLAMLGRRWLSIYVTVGRGSVTFRGRQRTHKMDMMEIWKFVLIVESLQPILEFALILFGCVLSGYLFSINRVVASVVIGFTALGLLSNLFIFLAATFSHDFPIRSGVRVAFSFLIRFDNEHKQYLRRSKVWFGRVYSYTKRWLGRKSGGLDRNVPGDHIGLSMATPPDQLPQCFDKAADWGGNALDLKCVAWMSKIPMDTETTMAIVRVAPEIAWNSGSWAILLEEFYDTLLECFDHSSGWPRLRLAFKDKAYPCAKGLLHVSIQRKCIGDEYEKAVFESIPRSHKILGSTGCEGNSDLESTLNIIDHVFGHPGRISWDNSSLTVSHRAWMAHILLYHAWDVTKEGGPLPDYIREFTLHSLRLVPLPPAPIVADCLLIVGLDLGIGMHPVDPFIVDKR